jgi:hypothetical protein
MLRKKMMVVGSCLFMIAQGCTGEITTTQEAEGVEKQGAIKCTMDNVDENIVAFQYKVFANGELIKEQLQWAHAGTLPAGIIQGASTEHRFADAYFVLDPGLYDVTVLPMMADLANPGQILPSQECTPAQAKQLLVSEGSTTETALVVKCAGTGSGGLDVIVTVNHAPRILDLNFQPSKFVAACEKLVAVLTTEDPDKDNLVYDWSIQGPAGVEYTFEPSWNSLRFSAKKPGDFNVTVKVCDDLPADSQLCTSLTFPIHVILGTDANQNGIGDLCEAQPCVPACGNRTCGPDPVCNASCGTCPCDQICTPLGFCADEEPHICRVVTGRG